MATPDELKQMVSDWCKEDNIPIKLAEQKGVMLWEFTSGNVVIYSQQKFPDRVFLQCDLRFDDKQIKLIAEWKNDKRTTMMSNLIKYSIDLDYQIQFLFDDKKNIKGVRIYKMLIADFTKSDFIHTYLRVNKIVNYNQSILGTTMGLETKLAEQQEDASSSNPLTS